MVENWTNASQNIKNAMKHFLSSPTIPWLMERNDHLCGGNFTGYSFNNLNRETRYSPTEMDLLRKKNMFSTPLSSELFEVNVTTRIKF